MQDLSRYINTNFIIAVLIFCSFQPFFLWGSVLNNAIPFLAFLLTVNNIKVQRANRLFLLLMVCLYIWVSVRGGFTLIGSVANMCILSILCLTPNNARDIFTHFRKIYSVVITVSLVVFVLVMFIGVKLPSYEIVPLNNLKNEVVYHAYPFLVVYESFGIILPRFCGLFDEPGVVGTIAGGILLAERYNFKDKFNYPILLSGLMSASLFFMVVTIVYLLFFANLKTKIGLVTILLIIFISLAGNEIFDKLIFSRLDFNNGKFSGDTRLSGLSDSWYKSFQESTSYYWGLGNNAHAKYNQGGCSYIDLIIDYGVIFLIFYVTTICLYAKTKIKYFKNYLVYLFLLFGIIYQRPFITFLGYFFLIIVPIHMLSDRSIPISNRLK